MPLQLKERTKASARNRYPFNKKNNLTKGCIENFAHIIRDCSCYNFKCLGSPKSGRTHASILQDKIQGFR